MTGGMERLYEGIEKGVIKLDDTLRQRTATLQAQRQAILTDIAGVKIKATVPAHVLQQKHIDAFTRLLREKLLENGAIRQGIPAPAGAGNPGEQTGSENHRQLRRARASGSGKSRRLHGSAQICP